MKKYSLADADKINWSLSDAKAILIPAIVILAIIFLGLSWRLHSHWSAGGVGPFFPQRGKRRSPPK